MGDKVKRMDKRKVLNLTLKKIIFLAFLVLAIFDIIIFCNIYFTKNETYAVETGSINADLANVQDINIDEIIKKNSKEDKTEEFRQEIVELEYLTEYIFNNELPQGETYVVQEGVKGTQKIVYKNIYENGKFVKEEKVFAIVEKPAFNKIIQIGKNKERKSYNAKVGDLVAVTSDELSVYIANDENSKKLAKLKKDDKVKVLKIDNYWYYISVNNITGWVKKEATRYIDEIKKEQNESNYEEKENVNKNINFNINLNKPSGLTLNQFKKVLRDKRDVNNIFKENAEYFYYIEKQYNINGIFVASIGIHESAWGTSKIALNKKNLFGYGAYDSNPYNGAYSFSNYSESIDLLSRVLVKYYLNPKGTKIYGGEVAQGTYYSSPTLEGVNRKYATDKNWANAVFNYMKYLYGKI